MEMRGAAGTKKEGKSRKQGPKKVDAGGKMCYNKGKGGSGQHPACPKVRA